MLTTIHGDDAKHANWLYLYHLKEKLSINLAQMFTWEILEHKYVILFITIMIQRNTHKESELLAWIRVFIAIVVMYQEIIIHKENEILECRTPLFSRIDTMDSRMSTGKGIMEERRKFYHVEYMYC